MLLVLLRRDAKRTPYPRNGEPRLFADGGHCARARDGKGAVRRGLTAGAHRRGGTDASVEKHAQLGT